MTAVLSDRNPVRIYRSPLEVALASSGVPPIPIDLVIAHKQHEIDRHPPSLAWRVREKAAPWVMLVVLAMMAGGGVVALAGTIYLYVSGQPILWDALGVQITAYGVAAAFVGVMSISVLNAWGHMLLKGLASWRTDLVCPSSAEIPPFARERMKIARNAMGRTGVGYTFLRQTLFQENVPLDPIIFVELGDERVPIAVYDEQGCEVILDEAMLDEVLL